MLSSGCDVHDYRVLLPEGIRIGEHATCPLGESGWSLLRIAMRATCHQGEGPYREVDWEGERGCIAPPEAASPSKDQEPPSAGASMFTAQIWIGQMPERLREVEVVSPVQVFPSNPETTAKGPILYGISDLPPFFWRWFLGFRRIALL